MTAIDGVLKYGIGGTATAIAAGLNFASPALHGLSFCTTPIELLSNDGKDEIISRGSGFFCRRGGRLLLVTNYHVASGRNALTGESLSNMGYFPKRLRYHGARVVLEPPHVRFERFHCTLEFDDGTLEQLTSPPLVNGIPVDIWSVPIIPGTIFEKDPKRTGFNQAANVSCVIDDYLGPPIATEVGSDCLLLGYPLANYEGLMPPIWKRGAIASEPVLGVDNRPMFLIDAAVTPSMSGSPVLRRAISITAHDQQAGMLREFATFNLIGVYAGRLQSRALDAVNLGYAWHQSLIDGVANYYGYSQYVPAPAPAG